MGQNSDLQSNKPAVNKNRPTLKNAWPIFSLKTVHPVNALTSESYLDGANTGNMLWHLNGISGIKLIVKKQVTEEAKQILEDAINASGD